VRSDDNLTDDQGPPILDPRAVFTVQSATAFLSLNPTSLPRAIRRGELRVSRRGGKYFILGEWLIAWLEGGTRTRRRAGARAD
jgi:hypothetical protein